jgi:type I restriction enzyme M protein
MKLYSEGKTYTYVIAPEYHWNIWACPKEATGKPDLKTQKTGEDLKEFTDRKLFPYLKGFKNRTGDVHALQY